MILVPRQLVRSGMTGNVPYYGGRFTPAQAYAASHPMRPPPPAAPRPDPASKEGKLQALQHLLDAGVISAEEFRQFKARVA